MPEQLLRIALREGNCKKGPRNDRLGRSDCPRRLSIFTAPPRCYYGAYSPLEQPLK